MAVYGQADPRLVRAILEAPEHLQPILLATALVESGGRLTAIGDGGHSIGPFQEHDAGRGAGLSAAERSDPAAAVARAVREFQTFWDRGARGPDLAYRAQRPANRASYVAKITAALPEARKQLAAVKRLPWASDEPQPGEKIAGGIGDAIGGGVDALGVIAGLAGRLLDPTFWLRAGMVVGGGAMLAAGVFLAGRAISEGP